MTSFGDFHQFVWLLWLNVQFHVNTDVKEKEMHAKHFFSVQLGEQNKAWEYLQDFKSLLVILGDFVCRDQFNVVAIARVAHYVILCREKS